MSLTFPRCCEVKANELIKTIRIGIFLDGDDENDQYRYWSILVLN